MKTYTIKNFDQLILFIRESESLKSSELNQILFSTIQAIMIERYSKKQTIEILEQYWIRWNKQRERPIFIDSEFIDYAK